ncbi:uncharacterized protein Dere_GG14641 [Drosophila erecta]|uniref:Uncharacterized protein n=1 Tax=Drosophila erecta TaxID=7220 RepID=B3NJB3_DROER|nr:uncharacterized protein Dere_GG14641 [Drosophila erecta]
MDKISILPDNLQSRVFALGPAPPGFRPPNAAEFASAESNLRKATRYLKNTYCKLDQLRTILKKERNNAKIPVYRDQSMTLAKQVIRSKELIGKYRVILIDLQDAEIFKVNRHIEQMEDLLSEVNNRLVSLRTKIQAETDPAKREIHVGSSFYLVREQHKTKGLCERWRDRLDQLTKARMDKTEQLTEKPMLINKPKTILNAETRKLQEAINLKQVALIKSGCKRCAYLRKVTKHGPSKLCKVCKKWADDEKAKAVVNKTTNKSPQMPKSKELEVRVRTDSVSEESTIKIEIEEKDETSNDEVDPTVVASLQNSLKSIYSKNMALAYVKVLQEYAMLNDNFRAIGLLTEVEKSVVNPPQNEDFDD